MLRISSTGCPCMVFDSAKTQLQNAQFRDGAGEATRVVALSGLEGIMCLFYVLVRHLSGLCQKFLHV